MSTLSDRISLALARKRGGSQAALARACNIKGPSVNNWVSGKTKTLRGSTLLAAARYLQVRVEWLSTGLGPMTEDNTTVLTLQDSARPPEKPAWPFQSITPQQWALLGPSQRSQVEGFIAGLLISTEANSAQRRA